MKFNVEQTDSLTCYSTEHHFFSKGCHPNYIFVRIPTAVYITFIVKDDVTDSKELNGGYGL